MSDAGQLWPGTSASLDMVMLEIRRISERLTYFSSLMTFDARVYQELEQTKKELHATKAAPAKSKPLSKSPWPLRTEAYLLFAGYCDAEIQRLTEKTVALENGVTNSSADKEWRERNERIAAAAIEREETAALILSHDLFDRQDIQQ